MPSRKSLSLTSPGKLLTLLACESLRRPYICGSCTQNVPVIPVASAGLQKLYQMG